MSCPVCRGTNFEPLGEKKGYPLVKCLRCTHRFCHPMPSALVLEEYYSRYWINHKNIRNGERKIRKLKRILRPFLTRAGGNRFLDIGCNTGFGVEAARQLGFHATGIDVSGEAIEIASSLYPKNRFVNASPQDFAPRGGQFDAILCREVVEHMPEVHSFMSALRALMKLNGLLWLTTPDAGHFRVPKRFHDWKEVIPPEHLSYFNRQSLQTLLREYDIEIVRAQWVWKPSLRILARRVA